MAKSTTESTTELFDSTLLTQRAKGSGFGASLLLHIVLGLTFVALPVTYVERWEESKLQVVVPLTVPNIAELKDLDRLQPRPRVLPKSPAESKRVRTPRFETSVPEKLRAPSRANILIEPAPLVTRTAPLPSLPLVELPPVPALEPAVRTGLLPSASTAPARQEPPKLQVKAGKFVEIELGAVQRRRGAVTRTGAFDAAAETRAAPGAAQRTVVAANFGGPSPHGDAGGRTRGKVTAASSFGAMTAGEVLGKVNETVRLTEFHDIVVEQRPRERQPTKTKKDLSAQVQIIEKLRPSYTAAAREHQIEGEVLLDVIFGASGTIQVLGVIKGLGYGLDARHRGYPKNSFQARRT